MSRSVVPGRAFEQAGQHSAAADLGESGNGGIRKQRLHGLMPKDRAGNLPFQSGAGILAAHDLLRLPVVDDREPGIGKMDPVEVQGQFLFGRQHQLDGNHVTRLPSCPLEGDRHAQHGQAGRHRGHRRLRQFQRLCHYRPAFFQEWVGDFRRIDLKRAGGDLKQLRVDRRGRDIRGDPCPAETERAVPRQRQHGDRERRHDAQRLPEKLS